MGHLTVADLMTPSVISVQRGTTFKEIARLLSESNVTAVPVVDEGGVRSAWSPRPTSCATAPRAAHGTPVR